MPTTLLVCGGKSTALEIAEVARRFMAAEYSPVLLAVPDTEEADGVSRIHQRDLRQCVSRCASPARYIISMWDQHIRQQWLELAESLDLTPANVIHPSVYLSDSARVGRGVYLAANVIVSVGAVIEDHVIVNYGVTVGHDSVVGSHSSLNPGARLSGHVTIGQRVMIGSNAFVFQGVSVGDDCLVDAMTYIDRNIEPRMICSSKQLQIHKRVF